MAGFRKAKAEQAALKIGIFGEAGSGKTFTSLLIAEGLAALDGKRIAFVDTERGTDFYAMKVPNRRHHPEAFDFDALYSRSISEVNKELFSLKPEDYGVVVIDSVSHLWEATQNAYTGKRVGGKIPFHAWGSLKKPYKDLMAWMINTPMHVMLLGRQANDWGVDDETGESVTKGVKMRAEGETQYEPHVLLRMEGVKPRRDDGKSVQKNAEAVPTMYVLKDRTGVLQGQVIEFPCFETVAKPIMGLLGKTQAQVMTDDDAASMDGEAMRKAEVEKKVGSAELKKQYKARFDLCKTKEEANVIAKELTPAMKKRFIPDDLEEVRAAWAAVGSPAPQQATAQADVDAPPEG